MSNRRPAIGQKIIENEAAYAAAVKRNIVRNARQTFNEWADHVTLWLVSNSQRNEFCGKLAESLDKYGKLSLKQVECVEQMMVDDWYRERAKVERKAQRIAADLDKGHVGEVGKRQDFELTVQHVHTYQRERFGYRGGLETVYIYIMRDAAQNVIVYKGTAQIEQQILWEDRDRHIVWSRGENGEMQIDREKSTFALTGYVKRFFVGTPVKAGSIVHMKATVKEHGQREGVAQTIVQRPKITAVIVEHHTCG
jgi:hypothetical protein